MIKKIFLPHILSLLLMSSVYAMQSQSLEEDFRQISLRYNLCPEKYTEDLREYYTTVVDIISSGYSSLSPSKKAGIVIGENHMAEGAKCLEILLLKIAESIGIKHCLVELTPEKLQDVNKQGYQLGASAGYLQRLIKEANRCGMKEIPIDKDISAREGLASLDQIKEVYIIGEEREKFFIEQILNLDKSFIFYTGANHLSSLFYDSILNDKYTLLFINCSFPVKKEQKEKLDLIIEMINDEAVTKIHHQREKFLTETERSYKMPVMYNRRDSMLYNMFLKSGPVIGANLDEIRDEMPSMNPAKKNQG